MALAGVEHTTEAYEIGATVPIKKKCMAIQKMLTTITNNFYFCY